MIWEKLGLIFQPPCGYEWMNSHAQVPFTVKMGNVIRIFFSTRSKQDKNGQFQSYSSYVDIDPSNNWKVLNFSKNPILDLGGVGEFDEFGIMAGSIISINDEYLLYYCGWQRLSSVPYNWSVGLAQSNDLSKFTKRSTGPIIGPRINEPYLHACPIVYESDDTYEMYLLTGDRWIRDEKGKLESVYTLKKCTSKDGIRWSAASKSILEPRSRDECQTSCSIFNHDGERVMIFSYRSGTGFRTNISDSYKIGMAVETEDGNWCRMDDQLQFRGREDDDWDSMMMAYPHILSVQDEKFMLYCGNEFGKNGFGLAKLVG